MVVIFERMRERGMVARSRPSMVIVPDEGSRIRRRSERRVLFPEPVRPQTPSFCPGLIWNEMFCRAGELSLWFG